MLRSTTTVDAPARTVAGVLRDLDVVASVAAGCGYEVTGSARLLSAGDEVRLVDGRGHVARVRLDSVGRGGLVWALRPGGLVHAVTVIPTAAGTRRSHELRWTSAVDRTMLRRGLAVWSAEVERRAMALQVAPVVVATALVRDGRVLAAQRTRPPALDGRWELPGGRVEAGESEPAAVVRECREELGTSVVPGERLGTDLPIDAGVLRVHAAHLAPGAPEPRALEHAALRWVAAAEVPSVDWVDADRAVATELVELLGAAGRSPGPGLPHLPDARGTPADRP